MTGQLNKAVACLLFLSLCPSYSVSQSRAIDPEIQKKIDDYIQNTYLPTTEITGLGLSVVQNDGEILYTTGYGMANHEKDMSVENSTQFLVASITKGITSIAAIKLLHEKFPDLGEGVMDTPIRVLMPDINFTLNDRFSSEQATFRDLLSHRLCYPEEDIQIDADPFDTTQEIVYRARYAKAVCGFRTQMQYNNQFYAVAGELLGLLTGKPYEELVEGLLGDIGMSDTMFTHRSDDFDQIPNRSSPYYRMDNQIYPFNVELVKRIEVQNAAGGLFSTPNDMAKYMRFVLNLGTIDGRQIIAPELMKWLFTPSNIVNGYAFKNSEGDLIRNQFGYCLGLILSTYDGWEYIQHSGYLPPYQSHISFYPGKKLGIFSTLNTGPLKLSQLVLHAFIFETLRGSNDAEEKAWKLKNQLESKMKGEGKESEKDVYERLKAFVGTGRRMQTAADVVGEYGNGNFGEAVVSEKFNENTNRTELYLEHGRWYKGWLEDVYGNIIFEIHWDTDVYQDSYATTGEEGLHFAVHSFDGNLVIMESKGGSIPLAQTGIFYPGVSLDTLPPVPWSPDSCGPADD